MKRVGREVWEKRVEQWRRSGKSAAAFAEELGVNPRSLKWWKWHLGAAWTAKAAPRKSAALATAPTLTPLTFVEMTAAVAVDAIELVLPSRTRVAVRPGFDERTLDRVLDLLERRA